MLVIVLASYLDEIDSLDGHVCSTVNWEMRNFIFVYFRGFKKYMP